MTDNTQHADDLLLTRLYMALEKMESELNALKRAATAPIAIIGMGCRFPGGADNPERFWQLVHDGVDAITEVPSARWDVDAYYDPQPGILGKMYTRDGGFLKEVDKFDPLFFGISPREAVSLDPQQRLLLEVSWEALEHANQVPADLFNSLSGVFVGISTNDYSRVLLRTADPSSLGAYASTGNSSSVAAGRLSYALGLTGPCMAVDTACSSSLVSVHLACQSLRNGECDLALAGGVNLILTPETTISLSQARMLAPDGRCKTFDAAADGYVRGEGCGMIVLKRLSDAVADEDNILAIIRGSAVNQDGPSGGLTVPNGPSQVQVIRQALKSGGVEPQQVSYIEAHGTGTSLGDPIEVEALETAYGKSNSAHGARKPLLIGSVKTNIGHLEAAAGIAGLIKVVLCLQHGTIPSHLHFKEPNPHIAWDSLSVKVAAERSAWSTESSRLAGVSSFGFSGTNAHIVLEEAPQFETREAKEERPLHLLTLSAKSPGVLKALASRYAAFLGAKQHPLADVCFTANTGRSHFKERLAVVAAESVEAEQKLAAFARGEEASGIISGQQAEKTPKVAFLFTGQGSQYVGMGQKLYETEPIFRQTIERCDEILRPILGQPLLSLLYAGKIIKQNLQSPITNHQSPITNLQSPIVNPQSPIHQTAYTQPALFALEYALAEVWKSYGIVPSVVMGHSVGEYVAACVAGVFSLEDGLKLVAERGRLMQNLPQNGEMVAVRASEEEVTAAILTLGQGATAPPLSIAAINGPKSVVISGERQAVQAVVNILGAQGIKTQPLSVSHAFHSPLMEPMRWRFRRVTRSVTFSSPRIKLISNVTGKLETTRFATPQYWLDHIRQPVRFADGMQSLHEMGADVFMEIGPKPTLLGMGRHCLPDHEGLWLPSLRADKEWPQLLATLAQLYVYGVPVDWSAFDKAYTRHGLVLPTYPFKRERHWIKTRETIAASHQLDLLLKNESGYHPLLGQRFHTARQPQEIYFESRLSPDFPAYLTDYRIYGEAIVPATAYLEMALAAGRLLFKNEVVLEKFFIQQGLTLHKAEATTVQLIMSPTDSGYAFEIFSIKGTDNSPSATLVGGSAVSTEGVSWTRHAEGHVRGHKTAPPTSDLDALQAACPNELPVAEYYEQLRADGLSYGPQFQAIEQLWCGEGQALGRIRLPFTDATVPAANPYDLHPILLDACTQLLAAAFPEDKQQGLYLPVSVERLVQYAHPQTHLWSHVKLHLEEAEGAAADIHLIDEQGQVIAHLESLRRATHQALFRVRPTDYSDWLYKVAWQAEEIGAKPLASTEHQARWLIFTDQSGARREPFGIGQQLVSRIEQIGGSAIRVSAGPTYQSNGSSFQINPSEPEHFEHLLTETGADLTGIVHLWGTPDVVTTGEGLSGTTTGDGLRSVLHLVQALAAERLSPRLWLVTRGAQPASQSPIEFTINPQQSMIWGLGRVIAQEHPELQSVRVDLAPLGVHGGHDEVQALFDEIMSMEGATDTQPHRSREVAFRDGVRLVARLARQRLTSASPMPQAKESGKIVPSMPDSSPNAGGGLRGRIRPDASYLITGGLGALGLLVAQWLKEQGARHLVLIGRRGVTSQAQQEVINELAETGTDGSISVTVMPADVANRAHMSQVIAECNQIAPLRGIIHAAGVLDDGILMRQTWERFEKVMAPKVQGTWHLHTLTKSQELDFFVCFSSIASLLGSAGQANYAAANAFMDGLAHLRRSQGLPALSINWGPWAEVGMAANIDSQERSGALQALPPKVGLAVLEELLSVAEPLSIGQVSVLPINWSLIQQSGLKDPFFEAFISPQSVSHKDDQSSSRPNLRHLLSTAKAPRARLLHHLRVAVAKVLALSVPEEIGLRQRLFDLGLDSLMAVELRNRLEADLAERLDPTLLFDYPTLEALESYLAEEVLFLHKHAEHDEEEDEDESNELEEESALDDLSEDELADLLSDKLDMMF